MKQRQLVFYLFLKVLFFYSVCFEGKVLLDKTENDIILKKNSFYIF